MFSVCITAQGDAKRAQFDGTWTYNPKQSRVTASPGSAVLPMKQAEFANELVWTSIGNEVRIKRTSFLPNGNKSIETKLICDGRGETNLYSDGKTQIEIKSTSSWKRDTLIRKIKASNGESNSRQVFSLSKDGSRLYFQETPSTRVELPEFSIVFVMVFDRKK